MRPAPASALLGLALLAAAPLGAQPGAAPDRLALVPAAPQTGAEVAVTYDAPAALAGADEVVLRGRLRTADDFAYGWGTETRTLARLARGADGRYRGRFSLPEDVVYAVLAVASADGGAVDTRLREGWPVLVHGPDGRPLSDAFNQQQRDLTGADSQGGLRSAQAWTEVRPDDPSAWSAISFHEQMAGGTDAADAAEAGHLARVRAFDQSLALDPDADRAAGLYFYARGVDDGVAERWADWLVTQAPAHPTSVGIRTLNALMEHHASPDTLLAALDELWDEVGPAHRDLVRQGLRVAGQTGDPAAVRRWAGRVAAAYPWQLAEVAAALLALPETRDEGAALLRAEIDRASDPDRRPLFSTLDGLARADAARAARLSGQLGTALADAGEWAAARPALDRALAGSWDADLLRAAARARLATADTAGAAAALARVVADPAVTGVASDTTSALGARLAGDGWPGLVRDARALLRERTLAEARRDPVAGPVTLASVGGEPVALADALADGGPHVLVLFSTGCQYCRAASPRINAFAERYEPEGVRVAVVMRDPPGPEALATVRSFGYDGTVYFDPGAELATALGSAGFPHYFVLDGDGAVRFAFTSLAELPRQVEALLSAGG